VAPPAAEGSSLRAEVRLVDRFGNVQLQARAGDMASAGFAPRDCVEVGGQAAAVYGHTFADAGPEEAVVYEDSSGWIAIALNGARAADRLAAQPGSSLTLSRCDR
jgi:S-adenosylmethionine hydrolase